MPNKYTKMAILALLISAIGSAGQATASKNEMDQHFADTAVAIFAGGCFWCMEEVMEKQPGVISVVSGYTGGDQKDPSYRQVSSGSTGHAEAVRVVFDPEQIRYDALLKVFWRNVDPIARNGQFCDHGSQYRAAIFPIGQQQRAKAEASLQVLEMGKPASWEITTTIEPSSPFFDAETHHQDFYKKNPLRYKTYKYGCGRAKRLKLIWGKYPEKHSGETELLDR